MRDHLRFEQSISSPPEDVFLFFSDPANLPLLLPRWQAAQITEMHLKAPIVPGGHNVPLRWRLAGEGSEITLSFRPFPLAPFRLRWIASIEEFVWGRSFVDLQIKGPFAYWRHRHTVERDGSGTLLRDEIEYEPPFDRLGETANRRFLRRQIERTFSYRHKRTLELLGSIKSAQS